MMYTTKRQRGDCQGNNGRQFRPAHPTTKPWLIYTPDQLQLYRPQKYQALYNERKFAQLFPKQQQTLSFTDDLPFEIREKIYHHVCDLPQNILELWQYFKGPCTRPSCPARPSDITRCRKAVGRLLSLMLLSKKIRLEVSAVFFGGTNFRFSAFLGIATAASWMRGIGALNLDNLQHLTMHVPHRSAYCYSTSYINQPSNTSWGWWQMRQHELGLTEHDWHWRLGRHGPDKGQFMYGRAVGWVFARLQSLPRLRHLELVVPWDYQVQCFEACGREDDGKAPCGCDVAWIGQMRPEELIVHVVEEHSADPGYWRLLLRLKQKAKSKELVISLVIHWKCPYPGAPESDFEESTWPEEMRKSLSDGKWLKAYADVMGYGFGHTWSEDKPYSYMVRYGGAGLLDGPYTEDAQHQMLDPPTWPVQDQEASHN